MHAFLFPITFKFPRFANQPHAWRCFRDTFNLCCSADRFTHCFNISSGGYTQCPKSTRHKRDRLTVLIGDDSRFLLLTLGTGTGYRVPGVYLYPRGYSLVFLAVPLRSTDQ